MLRCVIQFSICNFELNVLKELSLTLNGFQNQRLRETIFDMNEQKLHVHRLLEEQGAPVSFFQSVAKINTASGNVIYFNML